MGIEENIMEVQPDLVRKLRRTYRYGSLGSQTELSIHYIFFALLDKLNIEVIALIAFQLQAFCACKTSL